LGKKFNIRVYGILVKDAAILVSDEYIKGNKITKFPGGGLNFGEGTIDCVIREFKEELNASIEVNNHYYTTDFYVSSAFDPNSQVISIYYLVNLLEPLKIVVSQTPHNYEIKEGAQSFRWIRLEDLTESDFTLIIDSRVAEMLMAETEKLVKY
jgi:8-oxo-dGTP diphosphatase